MSMQDRPLSPHLQVYRWQWTMAYSILHRATGVGLGAGTLYLVWWLLALAGGAESFATVADFSGSWLGRLLLFGWTWAMFYHLGNGIRHLFWDTGRGFERDQVEKSAKAVLIAAAVLTVLTWILALAGGGA